MKWSDDILMWRNKDTGAVIMTEDKDNWKRSDGPCCPRENGRKEGQYVQNMAYSFSTVSHNRQN